MIKLIAAVSQNGIIGKNNQLPFDYPEDLKYFKNNTTGSVVIMGRKTYEGIGKLLPNRTNVIISSEPIAETPSFSSLKKAIDFYKNKEKNIWLIGGRRIYEEGMQYADSIHLTITPDFIYGSDNELIRFPWINPSKFYKYVLSPFKNDPRLTECVFLKQNI